MSLYKLTEELRECESLLDDGELTEEMLADTLDALGAELEDKAVSVAHFIRNCQTEVGAVKAEIERLNVRAVRLTRKAIQMEAYLIKCLQAAGRDSVKTDLLTIKLPKPRQVVCVTDASALASRWVVSKVTESADKMAIAKALKAGEVIPGAKLETGKQSIKIS